MLLCVANAAAGLAAPQPSSLRRAAQLDDPVVLESLLVRLGTRAPLAPALSHNPCVREATLASAARPMCASTRTAARGLRPSAQHSVMRSEPCASQHASSAAAATRRCNPQRQRSATRRHACPRHQIRIATRSERRAAPGLRGRAHASIFARRLQRRRHRRRRGREWPQRAAPCRMARLCTQREAAARAGVQRERMEHWRAQLR